MGVREQLQTDLATAMRQGDSETRDTIRLLLAAIKQVEIDQRADLDEEGDLAVIAKQAKQRRESIKDAETARRPDLVAVEQKELAICESYLPRMMTADEIRPVAEQVIHDVGAIGMQDMGRVMGQLMPKLKGNADGGLVSGVVRSLLQS
ncbi:MAG: GatB/YqeY domain-containing protein [Candidatus Promineifilaceae bacterium]